MCVEPLTRRGRNSTWAPLGSLAGQCLRLAAKGAVFAGYFHTARPCPRTERISKENLFTLFLDFNVMCCELIFLFRFLF